MIGQFLYTKQLPLLLPAGMDIVSNNCGSFDELENGEIESIIGPPEQIVLNDPNFRKRTTSDPLEPTQNAPYDEELSEDPENTLRTLLAMVIEELQFRNNGQRTVTENDARFLRNLPEVKRMFERAAFLSDIDVSELSTDCEKATCFAINLANLMWLHALMFSDEYNQRGILLKNWPLRHIHLNSVGYNVGQLGFVTLHDLHGLLFNLPNVFRSKKLSAFNVLSDPRIHFLVGQPNVFSPRIEVVSVDTLEKLLEESKNDYLRKFVIVQDMKLFIPMPLLLFIERISYDQNDDLDIFKGSNDTGGSDKLNVLIEMLRSKSLPYEKLLSQDIYLVMSTRFKIKFSHSLNELDDMTTLKTVVWRSCRLHRSLYVCLTQQTNIVRNTMLDDHLSEVACACSDKSNRAVCVNNSLLTMAKVFRPMLSEFHSNAGLTHKGLRCLYAILAYTGAASTRLTDRSPQQVEDSRNIYKVIETDFLRVPTSCICAKIKICLTVLMSEYDMHLKWPRWFDLYFADPNTVLVEIVEHGNAALACMWMGVEFIYRPAFEFSSEAYKAFCSLLCSREDASYVKEAYAYTPDVPLSCIIDSLISSRCPIPKLRDFVSTVLSIDDLSEEERVKYHLLLIGLRMISRIKPQEQIYYYKLAYTPQLIVEQLLLNKQTETLSKVLTDSMPSIPELPEKLQQEDSQLRYSIDDLLRRYAEKALHFHRPTTVAQCQSAALLHASIFKDGDAFYPPAKIPTEEEWIPNNLAAECLVCKKAFSVFTRRHHCRRCGRVVCNNCSLWKLKLSLYHSPQRVCEACFTFERQVNKEDCDSGQQSSSIGDEKRGERPLWILDTDKAVNERIRNQAIFDTAPDIELCFSILELHPQNSAVPRFLMGNAHLMLKILRQRSVSPANFDYPEISHIVKSLLLAAKLYCAHLGDTQGARQCEELTSESVMLNQMAKSNVAPPQPNKPIRDVKDWKKIRNIALEQQNWELALEVSTKNGLECESIWYLWAMHVLKSGDWLSARDKFGRSNLKRNTHMVNGILDILRSSVEKESPKGFAKFFQGNPKKDFMPVRVLDECLYYLRLYGSGEQLFNFLVDHDQTFEAVQTAYAKKIAPKKFVKRIYIPHLNNNEQSKILKYMENVDHTLVGWKEYGHEICVYCSGNRHFQALYETQLWLQDYYRAGLSCTMFYKMGAKCYADFQKNRHHLITAVAHFEKAIANVTNEENAKVDQIVDPRRIEKCARTVNLQLEISDLVCKNVDCAARTFNSVPTLFGVNDDRLSVILLLVDACSSWTDASQLVQNVIRTYCMDAGTVFRKIALRLMENGRVSEVKTLVEYVKANQEIAARGEENHVALIDTICAEVVRVKPQKPDEFIAFITDSELKFQLQIECGYLKSAYLMAVKMKRADLVEKILTEAQTLNKPAIVKICRTKLQMMSKQS